MNAALRYSAPRKHVKWDLGNGQRFVQPSTGSDWRGTRKGLATLNRILDSQQTDAGTTLDVQSEFADEGPKKDRNIPFRTTLREIAEKS